MHGHVVGGHGLCKMILQGTELEVGNHGKGKVEGKRKHGKMVSGSREAWARIHESVITYDGHISRPGITELELGPSENSYSRARKRSVIVVLEVGGFHTGCLVTKRCTAHG